MKLILPCPPLALALLLVSGSLADGIAIAFAPEEGTTLKRTFEARASYKRTDVELTLNGESIEPPGPIPDYAMDFLERISVTDEIAGVEEGRPTELRRTFDELHQETTITEGEEEHESQAGSALEGRSLRFSWDPEQEEYRVAAADDEELDEDLGQGLLEDMDLRRLLPDDEVEPGDEWELAPELYLCFMWPGGLLDFREEGQEESADAFSRQTIEHLEGHGTARLEELREEDGARLAVIHVELEITTGSESEQDVEGGQMRFEVEIERKIEGSIVWDLDHGHARSAELEAESSRQATRTGKGEDPEGKAIEFEESELLEGTIHYSATIERE